MVLLTATPEMLDAIASLPVLSIEALRDETSSPIPEVVGSPISHKSIIALAKICRGAREYATGRGGTTRESRALVTESNRAWTLDKLLRNTKPYIPPPRPKAAPTPEFTALMNRLRVEEERIEYYKLLSSSQNEHGNGPRSNAQSQAGRAGYNGRGEERGNAGQEDEEEEDPITPSVVTNIFLSIIMCGVAVFQVSRWWNNEGMRVLLSLAAAIIVGVAEVVVYAAYVRNVKRGRRKERTRKEKKVLLGPYTGDKNGATYDGTGRRVDDENEGDRVNDIQSHPSKGSSVEQTMTPNSSVEKDVIWGRGKHGGIRRRIRERWEKEQETQPIELAAAR